MPVLFVAHGSPMNAIEKNDFNDSLYRLGRRIPSPKAILVVSAHWMTRGTWITSMSNPKTIHDFHGFPDELYQVQYPAPGNPQLAEQIRLMIKDPVIGSDDKQWGLDHGTWSVLKHLYPEANIPVLQLSLDMTKTAEFHFELGKKLQPLRKQGVLIVGSGNVVHNLRKIKWESKAEPHGWAVNFHNWVKQKIEERDFQALVNDFTKTENGKLSVPTPDHYYPLLYILGASDESDKMNFEYEGLQNGSISMLSIKFS
ncbi:MAG: 4,5-DOPA-extradiol-dioxygenase [Bdellovibrio sp.]